MATLNTKTSIVDKLKSEGKDSSYSARKALAESSGIKNYTGTAAQNIQLLNSSNSVIKNQSNLVQSTATEKAKQNQAGVKIDNTVNNLTGENTNVNNSQIDPKTGKPLVDSNTQVKETPVPEGNIQDKTGSKYFSTMPKNMTYQLPNPSNEANKWVFDQSGKPYEMDSAGKVIPNQIAEQEYNTNVQKNKDIETQNAIYDRLKSNVSAAHQVVIDNIKQKS